MDIRDPKHRQEAGELGPVHPTRVEVTNSFSRYAPTIGIVAALHVGLIYLLISGLALRTAQTFYEPITVALLKSAPPPPNAPPVTPRMVLPVAPNISAPEIRIRTPKRAITPAYRPTTRPAPAPAIATPPIATSPESILVPVHAVLSTHTPPPYPAMSRRLGESGIVVLRLDVAPDGKVQAVTVENSSGSVRLDDAARRWVKEKWRYSPATRNGEAIESQVEARVVFDLEKGR